MKSMMILMLLALSFIGCAHREKILDANWASMKNSDFPQENQLVKVGDIDTSFCLEANSGTFGMIDEVTKKAESDYKIDYIRNASFYREIKQNCMAVTGEGYRKK